MDISQQNNYKTPCAENAQEMPLPLHREECLVKANQLIVLFLLSLLYNTHATLKKQRSVCLQFSIKKGQIRNEPAFYEEK